MMVGLLDNVLETFVIVWVLAPWNGERNIELGEDDSEMMLGGSVLFAGA